MAGALLPEVGLSPRDFLPITIPQPGGPGHPFLSGSSPLTCLACETLPVASYHQHSSQDHMTSQAPPLRQSRDAYGGDLHVNQSIHSISRHSVCDRKMSPA